MAETSKSQDPKSEIAWLVVAGLVALAIIAVPLAVGIGIWYALRRRLRRVDLIVMLIASLVALLLTWSVTTSTYFDWLGVLVTGNGSRFSIPIVAVGIFAVFIASAWGLFATTRFASVVPSRILNIGGGGPGDSLIPTDREKQRISVVTPPPSDLHVGTDVRSVHNPSAVGDRAFPIGVDRRGKPVPLSEREVGTHAVLLGATGSGKTVTIKTIAASLADLDWNVVVVDLKEDTQEGGLRDFCRQYSSSHAIALQELALSEPEPRFWFNPLAGMSPDEASNALMSVQEWDDGHWQAIGRTLIGQTVTLFYESHQIDPGKFPAPDMYSIGRLLGSPSLPAASKERRAIIKGANIGRDDTDFAYLATPPDDYQKAAAGLAARITNMYESDAGRRVLRAGPGRLAMDVTDNGMCYIGLNTLGMSELARVVSTSVLLRLSAFAGARTTGAQAGTRKPTAVIIDEANWIDLTQAQNLLARARSAGIAVFLCTQGPLDWKLPKGDFWPVITQNVNVGIIMRQGNEESAELCADYIGKQQRQTLLSQVREGEVTESGTMRDEVTHVVSAQELRALRTGEAIVRIGVPDDRVEWTKITMRDPNYRPAR